MEPHLILIIKKLRYQLINVPSVVKYPLPPKVANFTKRIFTLSRFMLC